jgi:hypothetical protein
LNFKNLKIVIPIFAIIIILVVFFGDQNTTIIPEYAKILEFSTYVEKSNLHLSVKTVGSIPRNISDEKIETNTLAFGYLWVESPPTSNEFTGILTNHHLIERTYNQGWHTENVKV